MKDKKEVIEEVKNLITSFSQKNLSEEEEAICLHIWEKLARKQKLDITRTRPDIWAATVIWSFCRANFKYEEGMTLELLCSFFNNKKSTVGNKAGEISKMFRIDFFNPEFTTRNVQDQNPLNQLTTTEEGLIIPKDMYRRERLTQEDEMATNEFRWEPEMVEGMTTEEIEAKMKSLVPGFDIGEFASKAKRYVSCEDMADEEYYPEASSSDVDEDFIWIACEVLWKRLLPDNLAVEHVADLIDNNIEAMAEAEEKGKVRKVVQLSAETFDLIYRHIVEESPDGYRLKNDFYEQLQESILQDIGAFLGAHLMLLQLRSEDEKVIELGEILSQVFEDDAFLDFKAQSLFALKRGEEGEACYREIMERNPDVIWFPVHAGDCFLLHGEKDFDKARDYYTRALEVAKKLPDSPESREDLYFVYEKVINLGRETGETAWADRMQGILDSLRMLSSKAAPTMRGKVGRNDPCPCGSGKKYKKCCGQNIQQTQQLPLFDPRLMERSLLGVEQLVSEQGLDSADEINQHLGRVMKNGKAPQWIPETPLEKAQSLVFEALEKSGKTRLKLVNQALKVSPDCADAYVLLAEEKAQNVQEALSLYTAGVKAGERALGEKVFQKAVGHFWGMIETRPYMRARDGLARCLWELGKHKEAVGHYQEMLRLNPNDNQGIRYILASCLLELGQINALQELLDKYDEPTADWLYTYALVVFLQQGNSSEARKRLLEALEHNRHVIPYLLGEKRLPKHLPDRVGFGDVSEAIAYAAEFGPGWVKAKGAISWLISICRSEQTIRQDQSRSLDVPEAFIQAFESSDEKRQPSRESLVRIYTFKVSLKKSSKVWRKIEIKGSQSLHDLHKATFKAYERYDEHLYAFFLNNKPWDNSAEYGLPDPERNVKNAKRTGIDSLGLSVNKKFLYLFDFGDEWWHSILLLDIKDQEPQGKYPRIIAGQGEAPPQYADYDEG